MKSQVKAFFGMAGSTLLLELFFSPHFTRSVYLAELLTHESLVYAFHKFYFIAQ